jgi:hypothetical protein
MDGINHTANENYSLSKDSHLKLSISSSKQQSPSIKKTIWKDIRLDYLDIPKGLVEVLQNNGFTVEKILDFGPSQIAEILGIDHYVAQIIFKETTKEKQLIRYNELYPEDQKYYLEI